MKEAPYSQSHAILRTALHARLSRMVAAENRNPRRGNVDFFVGELKKLDDAGTIWDKAYAADFIRPIFDQAKIADGLANITISGSYIAVAHLKQKGAVAEDRRGRAVQDVLSPSPYFSSGSERSVSLSGRSALRTRRI